jgi:hypothetical protein
MLFTDKNMNDRLLETGPSYHWSVVCSLSRITLSGALSSNRLEQINLKHNVRFKKCIIAGLHLKPSTKFPSRM